MLTTSHKKLDLVRFISPGQTEKQAASLGQWLSVEIQVRLCWAMWFLTTARGGWFWTPRVRLRC